MALNTTQRKTLRDILRNYVDFLLEKQLLGWLPKLIEPVNLTQPEVLQKLREYPEIIETPSEATNIPLDIRSSWRLLQEHVLNPRQAFSLEALRAFQAHPNYNPFNLVAMQMFETSVGELEEEVKKSLIALRELYLEMTPLADHSYGRNYRTFFFRIGRISLNLDHFGPMPQAGEIQSEVEDYLQERYELELKSQEKLAALTSCLRVSDDYAFAAQLLQEEVLHAAYKQPVASSSNSFATSSYVDEVRTQAALDSPESYYSLGENYYYGQGVTQNYAEAVKWYRKAAEQGDASAQHRLGGCYQDGQGVTQSYAEAVKWFQKAAEQGYAAGQYSLGFCYQFGEGVAQNYAEAVKWYRKAAEQEEARAQYNLGVCYQYGEGVTQSDAEAVKWYQKAAEQGHAYAKYNVGAFYRCGRGVVQNDVEAARWFKKAAEQGNADAQYGLGICYYKGHGVPQNEREAIKWLQRAAEQGLPDAQGALRKIGSNPSLRR